MLAALAELAKFVRQLCVHHERCDRPGATRFEPSALFRLSGSAVEDPDSGSAVARLVPACRRGARARNEGAGAPKSPVQMELETFAKSRRGLEPKSVRVQLTHFVNFEVLRSPHGGQRTRRSNE